MSERKQHGTPIDSLGRDELVLLCKIKDLQMSRLREKSRGRLRNIHEMQIKMQLQKGEIADLKLIRSDAIERAVHSLTGNWVDAETQVVQSG